MKTRLALGLLAAISIVAATLPLSAQNTQCSNRPAGDSTNACANTRFVTTAIAAIPGGVPGGANTQVQFNNAGAFGGSANLTWVSPALSVGAAGTTGQVKYVSTNGSAVTVQASATTAAWAFTWPTTAGISGQVLSTNGSGVTSWATSSSVNVFNPTDAAYGAKCDGVTDDTVAFQTMATAVRTAGAGTIEFPSNADCQVFPTPAVGTQTVLNLNATDGVTINFNNSRFRSAGTYTGGRIVRVIEVIGSRNITINGYNAIQTTTTAADVINGFAGIYMQDAVDTITINGAYQQYGRSLVECVEGSSGGKNLTIRGAIADNVFYGVAVTKNCEQSKIDIKGINTGRVLDIYNAKQVVANIISEIGTNCIGDVLLGVYTDNTKTAAQNTLSEVTLNYYSSAINATCPALVGMFIQQGTATTTPGFIRNVNVTIDALVGTAANTPVGFELYKQAFGAGADTTTRGHTLENFTLSGSFVGFANNVNVVNVGQFGTWGGETVRNINFKNLTSTGSGTGDFAFNATGFGYTRFSNVRFAHDLNLTNATTSLEFDWGVSFPNNASITQIQTANKYQRSQGAGLAPVWSSVVMTVVQQQFTASGTYTPTTGMVYVQLECVGGGGGGGGVDGAASMMFIGGGGGSGGYSRSTVAAATIGASKTVTIGAGGAGGAAGPNTGSVGTASCFTATSCVSGQIITANGGGGGSHGSSGSAPVGGPGATSGTGAIAAQGTTGMPGVFNTANITIYSPGGAGASSHFGGGASTNATVGGSTGTAAGPFGGGGSGGATQSASDFAGGNGSSGLCVATEFVAQ